MDNYTVEMDNYSLFLLSSDKLPLVHQKQSIPIKKEEEEEEEEEEEKKKRLEDNIRECRDLEFAKSQRAMGIIEKWRKLVVKSSVVPQRPPRLRDR